MRRATRTPRTGSSPGRARTVQVRDRRDRQQRHGVVRRPFLPPDHECVRPGHARWYPARLGPSGVGARGRRGGCTAPRSRRTSCGRRHGQCPRGVLRRLAGGPRRAPAARPRGLPRPGVVFGLAPPFRTLTAEEDEQITRDIEASGARIVFVGLGVRSRSVGCRSIDLRFGAVMVGVGAAFDFLAGSSARPRGAAADGARVARSGWRRSPGGSGAATCGRTRASWCCSVAGSPHMRSDERWARRTTKKGTIEG